MHAQGIPGSMQKGGAGAGAVKPLALASLSAAAFTGVPAGRHSGPRARRVRTRRWT